MRGDYFGSFPYKPNIEWEGVRCDSMSEEELRSFLAPNENYGISMPSDLSSEKKDAIENGVIEFGKKIVGWMKS